jgi:hypothetical protein
MKNKIQIYGLKKSGTNFLEFSLVKNFPEVGYFNAYLSNSRRALKHNRPDMDQADQGIIYIYKDYEKWVPSVKREYSSQTLDQWQDFLDLVKTFDESKCLILNHGWCVDNFEDMLKLISDKFNLTMPEKPIKPTKRLDKGGSVAKETKIKYVHYTQE